MAKYNKPNGNKANIGVIIVSLVFALIGLICILIGYHSRILGWLKTFGIVVCVLATPIILFVLYTIVKNKIKEM